LRSRILFGLILPFFVIVGVPTLAAEINKGTFEKAYGIFVWDRGEVPGLVDGHDQMTDFLQSCGTESNKVNAGLLMLHQPRQNVDLINQSSSQIIKILNLDSFTFSSDIIDAYIGEKNSPIFLLFPETHLESDVSSENRSIHLEKTRELYLLTKALLANGLPLSNSVEGPRGYWSSVLNLGNIDDNQRKSLIERIVNKANLSGGDAMAELFQGILPTAFVDTPGMNIKWAAAVFALDAKINNPGASAPEQFKNFQNWLKQQGAEALIEKYQLNSFFTDLVTRPADEIKSTYTNLCETRSHKLVENALTDQTQLNAKVVYLSFGALHIHGVIEALKEKKISYLLFSPNMSRPALIP
jgi:hypothetical protein